MKKIFKTIIYTYCLVFTPIYLYSRVVDADTETKLKDGIFDIMITGDASNTINFTADITITSQPLPPIYLANTTDTVTINGGAFTLSGGASFRGFFIERGTVSIDNITLSNMRALGGPAGAATVPAATGGGGLGAGSALFVGQEANVSVTNTTFSGSLVAQGGAGGNTLTTASILDFSGGGGGGLGGTGGGGGGGAATSAGGGGGFFGQSLNPSRTASGGGGMFGNGGVGNGSGGTKGGLGGGGVRVAANGGTTASANGAVGGFGTNGTTQAAGGTTGSRTGGSGAAFPIGGGGGGGFGADSGAAGSGGVGGFGGGGGGGGQAGNAATTLKGAGGNGGIFGGGGGAGGFSGGGGLSPPSQGGTGGAYGGGGGGSLVSSVANGPAGAGGAGGFGGGGGGAGSCGGLDGGNGGAGGFGAGGGGSSRLRSGTGGTPSGVGGAGGLGGGSGGTGQVSLAGSGGGGAALGGVIFVRSGGSLSIDASIPAGTVTAGVAGAAGSGSAGQNGQAFGTSIFINGNTTFTFNISSGTKTVTGTIVDDQSLTQGSGTKGAGAITKTGAGTVQFSAANTYTGATTITTGTLALSGSGSIALSSSVVANGTFDISGVTSSATITDLSGSGSVALGSSKTLTLGTSNNSTFSGVISDSSTASALTKQGSGTLNLTGINTYAGTTTINAGGITLSGSGTLGNGSATSSSQAPLVLNGGNLTIATGAGAKSIGTLSGNSGSSTINLTNNTLTVNQNSNQTYQGAIEGATGGALTKAGSSVLTLSGTPSYSGLTTISAGTLVFTGSTSSLTGAMSNTAAVIFNQSIDSSFAQNISGTNGTVTKQGAGNLTLAGDNSYTGITTISEGILTLTGDTSSLSAEMINNAAVVFNQSINSTFSPIISGSGTVTKLGSGNFTLSGDNSYSGLTTISAGTLILTGNTTNLGGDMLNNAAVNFNQSVDRTYSHNISGSGTLTKAGSSTLTLTGTNSYSGGTTISAGTLKGNALSLQGDISVGSNTVEFEQTIDGIYEGSLSGNGTFNKTGGEKLTLFEDSSSFIGQSHVLEGVLVVNIPDGDLQGTITIDPGARLQGIRGRLGDVINNGTVGPGDPDGIPHASFIPRNIDTLFIYGTYVQSANATLEIEINHMGNADLLAIAGTASLNGNVHALAEDGLYMQGTQFLILTADGGYGSSRFAALLEDHPQEFFLVYIGDSVYLVVEQNFIISAWAPYLNGNAKKTYDYLTYDPSQISDPNQIELLNHLVTIRTLPALTLALEQLCPALYSALPLVSFQNNVRLAQATMQKAKSSICQCQCSSQIQFWMQPIGFYYNQKGVQQEFGFSDYSYGVATGTLIGMGDSFFINPALGYTHSITKWNNNFGNAFFNTVYLSPSIGYSNGVWFASLLAQGSIDFYKATRNISFTGFQASPQSRFKSYNLLVGLDLGAKLELTDPFSISNTCHRNQIDKKDKLRFYLQPETNVYFVKLYQESFTENSNSYVNLQVRHKSTTFLQPNLGMKLVQEISFNEFCLSPSLYLGYLSNIPLGPTGIISKFYQMTIPLPHFSVEGYNRVVNQLSLGFEFNVARCDDFKLTVGYKLDFLSHMDVQMVSLKLNWSF